MLFKVHTEQRGIHSPLVGWELVSMAVPVHPGFFTVLPSSLSFLICKRGGRCQLFPGLLRDGQQTRQAFCMLLRAMRTVAFKEVCPPSRG